MIMIIIDKKRFSGGRCRRFLLADNPSLWPSPNLCREINVPANRWDMYNKCVWTLGVVQKFWGGRSKLDGSHTSFDGVQQNKASQTAVFSQTVCSGRSGLHTHIDYDQEFPTCWPNFPALSNLPPTPLFVGRQSLIKSGRSLKIFKKKRCRLR